MKGYDMFFPNKDVKDGIECKVCGVMCDVKRGVYGPTSFASAMGKSGRRHDIFTCPNREEAWHQQALEVLMEMEKNPSPSLKKIMGKDLKDIVKKKEVIGEWYKSFI